MKRFHPSPLRRLRIRVAQVLGFGVLLQSSSCAFDTETFISEGLAGVTEAVLTTLVLTGLSDLLNVAPFSGF